MEELRKCPHCGKTEHQIKPGFNDFGTQRHECKECGKYYTLESKKHGYSEETRQKEKYLFL